MTAELTIRVLAEPAAIQLKPADVERFWAKVERSDGDACWLFTAALDKDAAAKARRKRAKAKASA